MWGPFKPPSIAAFIAGVLLCASLLIGGVYAQNPGTGPNVYGAGAYGPTFTVQSGHFSMGVAGLPTANASCGTGSGLIGTDSAFVLTSGTSSNSGCTVTPAVAWKQRPVCSIDAQAATQPAWSISASGVISSTLR